MTVFSSGAEEEVPLLGGNTHDQVVRVGATVRRPTGPWTPAVHALLRHLDAAGFEGSPKVLGTDELGREVLTFVPGTVVWPDHFELVETDEALRGVAGCIRAFHDAASAFVAAKDAHWSDRGADPVGPYEMICHNDLGVWNLIHPERGWVFIDWDLAAPGRRCWDLAWAVQTMVPLWPERGLTDDDVVRRVRLFCSAYGMPDVVASVFDVALERCIHEADLVRTRGRAGEVPYARLLADGHDAAWDAAAAHLRSRIPTWKRQLGG
jgi:Phosphotransferase enzyme family